MTRFVLAFAVLNFALPQAIQPAEVPKAAAASKPEPSSGAPVYIKFLWPIDLNKDNDEGRPKVESWVSKGIEKQFKAKLIAVNEWVPLVEKRYETTDIWDGKLDGKECACRVYAVIDERKGGQIKIVVRGWSPDASEVTLALEDEPGSRMVVPVRKDEAERGVPHVAVFIGAISK